METKTKKFGFGVIQMVEIPEDFLPQGILDELSGREMYIDTDDDLNEKIYAGDVFEAIAGEYSEAPKHFKNLKPQDVILIDELAEELGEYELIRINRI